MRLLVIGGSDAGISAALRARDLDRDSSITVVLSDSFPNYSICGLPFYLSGETPDWRLLAHRRVFEGIELLRNTTARAIEPGQKSVEVVDEDGRARTLTYDCLVIATGAVPVLPQRNGLELPGVFPLHTMANSFQIQCYLERQDVRSAVIVGAGYIGMELADALTHRGLRVTLVGRSDVVFPTVDPELGLAIDEELRRHGVEVVNGTDVHAIESSGSNLVVIGSRGLRLSTDLVLVAVGVRPSSALASEVGISTGVRGAISVDRRMRTDHQDVFAAGDCVETWHRLRGRAAYLPLGTTSHKQGRVAGENAVGGDREFAGSVGTQIACERVCPGDSGGKPCPVRSPT